MGNSAATTGTIWVMPKLSEGFSPEDRFDAYEDFYAKGGWDAHPKAQTAFLRKVIDRAGWERGSEILELGCGMGLHAALLAELGMTVDAVDASETGIASARKKYRHMDNAPRFLCEDATQWEPELAGEYDGIFCRGMSLYHYELLGENLHGYDVPTETARFFDWLRPGGTFVLQICTKFTGERPHGWVHHNKLEDYLQLFGYFGDVMLATDWDHKKLDAQDPKGRIGVVIYTRKR